MQGYKFRRLLAKIYKENRDNKFDSIRGFARSLDEAPGTISQILNGSRKVTFETANRIMEKLAVPTEIKNNVLLSLDPNKSQKKLLIPKKIKKNMYYLFQGWEDITAYAALSINDLPRTYENIATRTGIPIEKVKSIIDSFLKSGLAFKNGEEFCREVGFVHLPISPSGDSVNVAIKSVINKSLEILDKNPDRSLFDGFVIAIDEEEFPEVLRRVQEFKISLINSIGQKKKSKMYAMQLHFFPINPEIAKAN